MAFSFGNSGNAMLGNTTGAGGLGPDLETIQTEDIGFLSIASDAKVRLTSSWSSLPSSTSSLLSIASRKGLVAAAGPDQVILATTESVRKAFEAPKDGDSDIRAFEPQLKMPMPMRVSQLTFTSDENYLIMSAESGGGLAVYEVQSLLSGSINSAFELSTNGESLRYLAPNPTPEKAELCAIVTSNGNLHMANLKERVISNALRNQVSCISWSSKGKQLCAGMGDGTIVQLTPEGEVKAEISKPPNVGDFHVSSLIWLENHLWLSIHTSNNESPPTSIYHIITRQPPATFSFQKVTDPVEPFGSEKTPHHTILRLRDFPPALQDLLIVSSTAATELGMLTRSKTPLATDKPADSITGVFTTTEFLDDTRRPTLPMTDSMDDSTPIGISLDLSGKEKVYKPIPSDVELEESPTPLPGLWVLTHEGILCSWWVVYNDSIRQGTAYPGLTAVEGSSSSAAPTPAAAASPFGSTGASAFGSSTPAAPAFGSSSGLGQKSSPWGAPAAGSNTGGATFGSSSFGSATASSAPAFGKPSAIGFGQSSQIGQRASPWASAAAGSGSAPAFGQSGFASFAGNDNKSAFGSAGAGSTSSAAPSAGGFASFASQSGFGSVANNTGSSVFGSGSADKPAASAFGSSSSFGTAFPPKQDQSSASPFGSSPFKLESSFKPDPNAQNNTNKAAAQYESSMFGSTFGSALGDAASTPTATEPTTKEEEMDTGEPGEATPQGKPRSSVFGTPSQAQESTTPTSTPAPSKFGFPSTTPQSSVFGQASKPAAGAGGLFGSQPDAPKTGSLFGSQSTTTQSSGGIFGSKPEALKSGVLFGGKPEAEKIKKEDNEVPLPPDTTSKESAEATKAVDDAPLPPDFVQVSKPKDDTKSAEAAPLPPDFTKSTKSSAKDVSLPPDPAKANEPYKNPFDPSVHDAKGPFNNPFENTAPPPPESSEEDSDLEDDEDEEDEEGGGDEEEEEEDEEDEEEEEEEEEEEDDDTEGSGIDVAKDLSPETTGIVPTPGYTPTSSFGGPGGTTPSIVRPNQDGGRSLFSQVNHNAPVLPRPNQISPRSPSPLRGAGPNRAVGADASRFGGASGIGSPSQGRQAPPQNGAAISSREKAPVEDPFIAQQRKLKARQEAEETKPLIDQEDDEVQRILASDVEGSLALDEFIAHSNVAPPAKESIPSQVEAVYRDINSMIDTLGLNARTVKSFIKGHTDNRKPEGRDKNDLEIPDDWVLCEVEDLGDVLDDELYPDLEDGRVRDLEDKLDACHELSRDMHRLRAKQEDLKKIMMVKMDPDQGDISRSMPLSAEQATQQNELRREFANFSKLLSEAEEALTLLKTRIATASGSSGKGNTNIPTVEAVMRTISKMTTMVEKRSGDVDVLETQLRRMTLGSASREGSPMVTPQARRNIMFSPESTPIRGFRHSLAGSVSLSASTRGASPRKKLSGFSQEEKGGLMDKRARRQAILGKLKDSVDKRGVTVWNMEDIE